MAESFSANLFLFQAYVGEVLKETKKAVKVSSIKVYSPFYKELFEIEKHQRMEVFHQYFLVAMGQSKLRELACNNYEKLLKQNLVDRENLPTLMVSTIISACSSSNSQGGSTTGSSSMGSATLVTSSQNQSNYLAALIKTILLTTMQPAEELKVGLGYLLEGTHKKSPAYFEAALQEIYRVLLVDRRQPALARFTRLYLSDLLDEVEGNFQNQNYVFSSRKCIPELGKADLPTYEQDRRPQSFGKYGRCFMCKRQANHYSKEDARPICSLECKHRMVELVAACELKDDLDLLSWLIDNLPKGDPIVYEFLKREVNYYAGKNMLDYQRVQQILRIGARNIGKKDIASALLHIFFTLSRETSGILKEDEWCETVEQAIITIQKVYFLQVLLFLEQQPVQQDLLDYVALLRKVLMDRCLLEGVFLNCDCCFFESSIVQRMFNLVCQYAKHFRLQANALMNIINCLGSWYLPKDTATVCFGKRTAVQFACKNQLPAVIELFNQKPTRGIAALHLIFQLPNTVITSSSSDKSVYKHQTDGDKLETGTSKNSVTNDHAHKFGALTARHIAIFIRQNIQTSPLIPGNLSLARNVLDKSKVGEYFGSPQQEAQAVCAEFMKLFVFEQMDIEDALRTVLNVFNLPKETQQVERILASLSARLNGISGFENDTAVYQYIYILLMVQTNQNPNVPEKDRLKLEDVLNMCKYVQGGVERERAIRDFNRIVSNPLNNRILYSEDSLFSQKHFSGFETECQSLFLIQEADMKRQRCERDQETTMTACLLRHVFRHLLDALSETLQRQSVEECILLYGKYGLAEEQNSMFKIWQRISESGRSATADCNSRLLLLSTEHGNSFFGIVWQHVVRIVYSLEYEQYSQSNIDKLFTSSRLMKQSRLLDFTRALLLFSAAELKTDAEYNRELFVLRHITEIMEYNLNRLAQLWDELWPMISGYFRDICLHLRKDIAMAAIDSFKQLTLKIFSIGQQSHNVSARHGLHPSCHSSVMQTYQYIFERSPAAIKDLIVNILLNVVTSDMQSGWEFVYNILEISDSEDKQLPINIISRLVNDIGLHRLAAVGKLHSLCLKEMKICGDGLLLGRLVDLVWVVAKHINLWTAWLETIRSIKDIYKMTLSTPLLQLFYRICNQCILQRQTKAVSIASPASEQFNEENQEGEGLKETCGDIGRIIYSQIVQLLIYLVDLSHKNISKMISVAGSALDEFQALDVQFVIRYLGGSYGFLSVFQMYLNSQNKLIFVVFLKKYVAGCLLQSLSRHESETQLLLQWVLNAFCDNLPSEITNLKEVDADFNIELDEIITRVGVKSGESANSLDRNELIEFHLSSLEYYQKSMIHLVLLEVLQCLHPLSSEEGKNQIQEALLDSYQCALSINKLVLLRNFLWRNSFLSGVSANDEGLPGLHKQEHRCLETLLRILCFAKAQKHILRLLEQYLRHIIWKQQLSEAIDKLQKIKVQKGANKKNSKNSDKQDRVEVQFASDLKNLKDYLKDQQQWIVRSDPLLLVSLERVKRELNAQGDSKEWAAQFTVVAMQIIPVKGIGKAVTDALTDVVIYLAEQLL